MADYYAVKKYSGRAGVFGDYSKVEGEFHADSNSAEISRDITKNAAHCVDYVMNIAAEQYKKERKNND